MSVHAVHGVYIKSNRQLSPNLEWLCVKTATALTAP